MIPGIVGHVRSRRALVWAGVLALTAVLLAGAPLFDSLGFEFAFALGLPAALAATDLGAKLARTRPELSVPRLFAIATAATWLLLLSPLVIISLNAFRVRQCDWWFGLESFALLPMLGVAFGSAAGVFAARVLPRRPRTGALLAWLIPIASVVIGVWRFYAAPPIFGYDAFAGYFPGTLYDEQLDFPAAFYWARLYQACFALAALAAVSTYPQGTVFGNSETPFPRAFLLAARRHIRAVSLAVVAALAAGVLFAYSGRLGFAVDAGDIARALGGRRETEHFIIHYPARPEFEPLIDDLAQEHEFRYAQVAERLDAHPTRKIHSFYFATADDKWRWMGARNTYIAKPWRHEIYIQHEAFPHPTLRHEIAHVFAGEFGDPLFHVSVEWWGWPPARFNVGLIEGVAVAADWPAGQGGRLTPHQSVRAMQELKLLPPLRRLLAPGFFEFSPAQSYTTAGSFVYFLLEHYGAQKVQAIYRAGGAMDAFDRIYGKPLAALEEEWHAETARAPLAPDDLEIARERYRRRAIFGRPCPHAIAERIERASRQLARKDARGAVATLARVCADDPGEPSYRLMYAAALERAGEPAEAASVYAALYDDDGTRYSAPLRARALWRAAELAARTGDLPAARALVDRALALAVDEDTRRNLIVRRIAFADDSPGARALRDYLLPPVDDDDAPAPTTAEEADPMLARAARLPAALGALGHYLYGRALSQRSRNAEAAVELAAAATAGLDEPLIRRENDRLLALSSFLAGDCAGTRTAVARLAAADQPLPVQLEAEDWLERCSFRETGQLHPGHE